MKIININEEVSKSEMGSFKNIVEFNGSNFGACNIAGVSDVWEMHPDTDELFHILEGEAVITLLEDSGEVPYRAVAGSMFAIPKGVWHKQGAPNGVKFIYYTPGKTVHSEAENPREQKT
ncbi:MAG: cupin domain-containing protein [Pseudomonadales bacterium]|nr:cupin domain-containing protein [Pseudomonadales bacterium]